MFNDDILRSGLRQISEHLKLSRGGAFEIYPEKEKIILEAGQTYKIDRDIEKSLLYISVDIPEGVQCTIYKDRAFFAYFEQQAGGMPIPAIRFETMQIEVENTTAESVRWCLSMSWGSD